MIQKTECVACTSNNLVFFGNKSGHCYHRCLTCGTLQLVPMPDSDAMKLAYEKNYAASGHCQALPEVRNQAALPQFQAITKMLVDHCNPELVLDYGPGWGGLLKTLNERGIPAEGAELSELMVTHCRAEGFTIHQTDLANMEGNGIYDAIVMSSVFEHLTDHVQWLTDAKRLLKQNGLVVSLQPTSHFASLLGTLFRFGIKSRELPQLHQVFWPPWHTVLFSTSGMRTLVESQGFDMVEIRPAPLQREDGFTGILQRSLSIINNAATPLFGVKWPMWVGHIFAFRVK